MYSKKYQHPKFPLREFELRWEARFQHIELFYQNEKIADYENLKALKAFPVVESESIGEVQLEFIKKPMGFELRVDGFNSPQNQRFALKRIRSLKFILAIPFLIYAGIAAENLRTCLFSDYRYYGLEAVIALSSAAAVFTLVTFIFLQLGKPFLLLAFFWIHNVFGVVMIMLYLMMEISNLSVDEYTWTSSNTENLLGFLFCMGVYFTFSYFVMKRLFIPSREWFRQKKFLDYYPETLD